MAIFIGLGILIACGGMSRRFWEIWLWIWVGLIALALGALVIFAINTPNSAAGCADFHNELGCP